MSKHDTWVFLKTPSPYDAIKPLFPNGFPMRDPFPMTKAQREAIALWIVDLDRLNNQQLQALASVIAERCGVLVEEVIDEAIANNGLAINHDWVEKIEVGAEAYARSKEWADFLVSHAENPSIDQVRVFMADQIARWVNGDATPPPVPTSINDVPDYLRTPELEAEIKRNRINQALQGYSVMDILTGGAMIDIFNAEKTGPDVSWELVNFGDGDDEDY